jgi:hypothetical protein
MTQISRIDADSRISATSIGAISVIRGLFSA